MTYQTGKYKTLYGTTITTWESRLHISRVCSWIVRKGRGKLTSCRSNTLATAEKTETRVKVRQSSEFSFDHAGKSEKWWVALLLCLLFVRETPSTLYVWQD